MAREYRGKADTLIPEAHIERGKGRRGWNGGRTSFTTGRRWQWKGPRLQSLRNHRVRASTRVSRDCNCSNQHFLGARHSEGFPDSHSFSRPATRGGPRQRSLKYCPAEAKWAAPAVWLLARTLTSLHTGNSVCPNLWVTISFLHRSCLGLFLCM